MKTKITILSALMLLALIAFGQGQIKQTGKDVLPKIKHGKVIENSLKSEQGAKQRLDSIIGEDLIKYYATYDSKQKVVQLIVHFFDEDYDSGEIIYRSDYEYDNSDNVIRETFYYDEGNDWIKSSKYEFEYDQNNNITTELYSEWDDDINDWKLEDKYESEYNQDGTLAVEINSDERYNWVTEEYSFGYTSKVEYEYDRNKNILIEISYSWDLQTEEWTLSGKLENEYDEHENNILELYYSNYGSNTEPDWTEYSRYKSEYIYDANYNVLTKTRYSLETGSEPEEEIWVEYEKFVYEYDTDNRETLYEYYSMSNDENTIVLRSRDITAWDQYGNLLSEEYYNWDWSEPSELESAGKTTYTYDYTYTRSDIILPIVRDDEFELESNNMMTKMSDYEWDESAEGWVYSGEAILYYSSQNVSVHNINSNSLKLYPNPVNDMLYLDIAEPVKIIEVLDISGRIVKYAEITDNRISLNNLINGMYVIKIKTEKEEYIQKIIKE